MAKIVKNLRRVQNPYRLESWVVEFLTGDEPPTIFFEKAAPMAGTSITRAYRWLVPTCSVTESR